MKRLINVYVIESEMPHSTTSVRTVWADIRNALQGAGVLGRSAFYEAPSRSDLLNASAAFSAWTRTVPKTSPIVLWLSVHGADPEPKVPDAQRRYVGTSGASVLCEKVQWVDFLSPIKSALCPQRIVVLMDVYWGSSPTAPARLTVRSQIPPALLFGPARRAYRHELDVASKCLFFLLAKNGIPEIAKAMDLVDSVNLQFAPAQPGATPLYRVWWWDNGSLKRYPEPPAVAASCVKRR